MEQKRPKRRKDKYNPYTICRMNGKYYICFYNGNLPWGLFYRAKKKQSVTGFGCCALL